ncbi:hypothetical protein [Rhodanobacter sp. UC4436_H3]
MSTIPSHPLPTTRRLLKATAVAIVVAGALLVTTVLPAEYGIDPTGMGKRLGLNVLAETAEAAEPAVPAATGMPTPSNSHADDTGEAAKAAAAFGVNAGQTFDTQAIDQSGVPIRHDTLTVELLPGKGTEVKALLKSGDGAVFHWTATGEVAVDMHGERSGVKNAWTSYWVEQAQREGAGTFVAPFDGSHGWYWENRGTAPVTVRIEVTGFQEKLYRPGQS